MISISPISYSIVNVEKEHAVRAAPLKVMVHTGMPIGVKAHGYVQATLEKRTRLRREKSSFLRSRQ